MVQFEDADTDDIIRIKTILSSLMILEMLSHDYIHSSKKRPIFKTFPFKQ